MARQVSQEEFARLYPQRLAEAQELETAWPYVGAHFRGELIDSFYASLMAEGRYGHEEAMGLARAAAGMQRGTDPSTILPIGPVNQAVLNRHGVRPARQGPKAPPPQKSIMAALRALAGSSSNELPPPVAEPMRASGREAELMAQFFVPVMAPPSQAESQFVTSPRHARMAGQILAAVLAGAGGLIGAGIGSSETP